MCVLLTAVIISCVRDTRR